MTEQTVTPEEMSAEIERLRAKNTELLAELKAAKGKGTEAGAELETLRAQVEEYRLNKPVADLLSKILVSSKYSASELAEHFTFGLDAAGELEMRDTEGNPVQVTEKIEGKEVTRPIRCEEEDVWRFLAHDYGKVDHIIRGTRASGGGAGGHRPGGNPGQHQRTEPKSADFGLR